MSLRSAIPGAARAADREAVECLRMRVNSHRLSGIRLFLAREAPVPDPRLAFSTIIVRVGRPGLRLRRTRSARRGRGRRSWPGPRACWGAPVTVPALGAAGPRRSTPRSQHGHAACGEGPRVRSGYGRWICIQHGACDLNVTARTAGVLEYPYEHVPTLSRTGRSEVSERTWHVAHTDLPARSMRIVYFLDGLLARVLAYPEHARDVARLAWCSCEVCMAAWRVHHRRCCSCSCCRRYWRQRRGCLLCDVNWGRITVDEYEQFCP